MVEILRYQFSKGYAGRLDVVAQESQLAQVMATLPPLLKQEAQLQTTNWRCWPGGFPNQFPGQAAEVTI